MIQGVSQYIKESSIEEGILEQLKELGYCSLRNTDLLENGERVDCKQIFLFDRLKEAIARLNPSIPKEARESALRQITATEKPNQLEENHRLHTALVEGISIEYRNENGEIRGDKVHCIDFEDSENNNWLAVRQFTVLENKERRADIVLFVNGIPLVVFEVKGIEAETGTLEAAYNQLQNYKKDIPSLFRTNALLVISDGLHMRAGSLSAPFERFMRWRTKDGKTTEPNNFVETKTLLVGMLEKSRLLSLIRDFTAFQNTGSGLVKIIAAYHQFWGVRKAVKQTLTASAEHGDRKIGVIWHTQGSGKSLLMLFYAAQLVGNAQLKNPTIVVITDRNDLDDQLFTTFSQCKHLLRQSPQQAESRKDLREKLFKRQIGGIFFTTLQKFFPDEDKESYTQLTDRRNVIVIADEAHRSQYGLGRRFDHATGKASDGFAKHMRDAFPNASFIGFTATPIELEDRSTKTVFGETIDTYDINQSVEDGATVPIRYEGNLIRIELKEEAEKILDTVLGEEDRLDQEYNRKNWITLETIVGAEKRIKKIAKDILQHFEARTAALTGKGMIVCMSRRIAVDLYNEIVTQKPNWNDKDNAEGCIKIVMSGSVSDKPELQAHIKTKAQHNLLAKRIRDPEDSLKLVIVVDMWLTGFDAPPLHTMYIDKPMRGHTLMQAIARINRVFRDKPAGLVVDYIGIAQKLKEALSIYSSIDQKSFDIDPQVAIALLKEKFEIVEAMFHNSNIDLEQAVNCKPEKRALFICDAIEWILDQQQKSAEQKHDKEEKTLERKRFQQAVLNLSKTFALVPASPEAKQIRNKVAFFQAVRLAIKKIESPLSSSSTEQDTAQSFAIKQIIDESIYPREIINILSAAGLPNPDISILSDSFFNSIQKMNHKNLAIATLKRVLNNKILERKSSHIVESKKFFDKIKETINRYHLNAITSTEIIQELINIAKELRESEKRGQKMGLTDEESAFYEALAENDSAVEILGDKNLMIIAQTLLNRLKNEVSIDWHHRESARARLRTLVRRILTKHGYPPDLQESAVKTVIKQMEEWAKEKVNNSI